MNTLDTLDGAGARADRPPLTERYRPKAWHEVIGQDRALDTLASIVRERASLGGLAYEFTGPSGTGKSTLARLVAASVADPMNIWEIDGPHLTAALLDKWVYGQRFLGMGAKPGHAYIVNEAHHIRPEIVPRLLDVIEQGRIPAHVVWCFTSIGEWAQSTFVKPQDAGALLSRCVCVPMARQGLCKPFAKHAKAIAEDEGLNGQPLSAYERLAKRNHNNLRAMLQEIEAPATLAETEKGA